VQGGSPLVIPRVSCANTLETLFLGPFYRKTEVQMVAVGQLGRTWQKAIWGVLKNEGKGKRGRPCEPQPKIAETMRDGGDSHILVQQFKSLRFKEFKRT
jgi:hypothetical protein